MKHRNLTAFATAALVMANMALISDAQTAYSTPSLEPISFDPNTWYSTGTTSLTIDFGPARGLGTVTITSLNGGGFYSANIDNPVTIEEMASWGYGVTETTLSNGDTLSLDQAIIFSPTNNGATGPAQSGFAITFSLNSGVFGEGDIFAIGSLDVSPSGRNTYFQPGASLLGPDAVLISVPTDGVAPVMVVPGTEGYANGPVYTANGGAANGVSEFAFFRLAEDTNTFTTYVTSVGNPQGVIFTLGTPTNVPEPGGALLIGCAGLITLLRRRRLATR